MINWTEVIITFIGILFSGGGLVTIFTISDKKYKELINNIHQLIKMTSETNREYKDIIKEYSQESKELKESVKKKDAEIENLNLLITEKRNKISAFRDQLIKAEILRCEDVACQKRKPPFSKGSTEFLSNNKIKEILKNDNK